MSLIEQIPQDLRISQSTVLKNTIIGNVTVEANSRLELFGIIIGDLYLEPDSEVILYGMLKGNAYNQGGNLRIEGVVKGQVYRDLGNTALSSQAIVNALI